MSTSTGRGLGCSSSGTLPPAPSEMPTNADNVKSCDVSGRTQQFELGRPFGQRTTRWLQRSTRTRCTVAAGRSEDTSSSPLSISKLRNSITPRPTGIGRSRGRLTYQNAAARCDEHSVLKFYAAWPINVSRPRYQLEPGA